MRSFAKVRFMRIQPSARAVLVDGLEQSRLQPNLWVRLGALATNPVASTGWLLATGSLHTSSSQVRYNHGLGIRLPSPAHLFKPLRILRALSSCMLCNFRIEFGFDSCRFIPVLFCMGADYFMYLGPHHGTNPRRPYGVLTNSTPPGLVGPDQIPYTRVATLALRASFHDAGSRQYVSHFFPFPRSQSL